MSTFAQHPSLKIGYVTGTAALGSAPEPLPPLFAGVLPAEFTSITSAARSRNYSRGEIMYLEGDTVHQVILLTSGFIKIGQNGRSGSEVILRLGVPGDVLGASSLLTTGKHHTTAEAFRTCRVLIWDERVFRGLAERYPILHKNIARILERELFDLAERFRDVATEKVSLRVARQLSRLRDRIGRQVGNTVEICLSRDELARMTGTTLFTVSRLLSRWEESGMLKPRRESVTITDDNLLQSFCEE